MYRALRGEIIKFLGVNCKPYKNNDVPDETNKIMTIENTTYA